MHLQCTLAAACTINYTTAKMQASNFICFLLSRIYTRPDCIRACIIVPPTLCCFYFCSCESRHDIFIVDVFPRQLTLPSRMYLLHVLLFSSQHQPSPHRIHYVEGYIPFEFEPVSLQSTYVDINDLDRSPSIKCSSIKASMLTGCQDGR